MNVRTKACEYARIGLLIAAIALAKLLIPGTSAHPADSAAGPTLTQPAPIFVKTIRENLEHSKAIPAEQNV